MNLHSNSSLTKPTILLMGASIEGNNRGVSALAVSLVSIFNKTLINPKIVFFQGGTGDKTLDVDLGDSTTSVQIMHYRMSPRSKLKENIIFLVFLSLTYRLIPTKFLKRKFLHCFPVLNSIANADFIGNIHGGDSFSDIYGITRFLKTVATNFVVIILGKDLILLPQTYGPFRGKISRYIAKYILNNSKYIMSRDKESIEYLKDLFKIEDDKLIYCPDVAFLLEKYFKRKLEFLPLKTDFNVFARPIVGINISGLLYNGGYTGTNMFKLRLDYKTFVKELIKHFLNSHGGTIILIPHVIAPEGNINSDSSVSLKFMEHFSENFNNRIFLLNGDYNQSEIKSVIGRVDFFVGARMHSCIAALSQGVPTVGIAYSRKFIGVFNSINAGELIVDATTQTVEEAINKIDSLFLMRCDQKEQLIKHSESSKRLVTNSFEKVLSEILTLIS